MDLVHQDALQAVICLLQPVPGAPQHQPPIRRHLSDRARLFLQRLEVWDAAPGALRLFEASGGN